MASMTFFSADPISFESVSQVTATNSVDLGTRRTFAGEDYVYCYNSGGGEITIGRGVKPVTAASGYSVAATQLTDVVGICVGVVKNTTMTTATYGWIMTRGFLNVVMVSATTADYQLIGLGVDGKFVQASHAAGGTAVVCGHVSNINTGAGGTAYACIKTGF